MASVRTAQLINHYRWCVTLHSRASYVSATNAIAGMKNDSNICPKGLSSFDMIQIERLVEKVISSIGGFMNRFEVDGDLTCLSSGHTVPDNLATNLATVQYQGEQEFETFEEKRLQSKVISFQIQ